MRTYQPYGVCGEDLYDCAKCGERNIDPFDKAKFQVKGDDVCKDCVDLCWACNEPIDNTTIPVHGDMEIVAVRELNDRRETMHKLCAQDYTAELAEKGLVA